METVNIKSAIEAILFAAGEPVPAARISLILGVDEVDVFAAAKELSDEYSVVELTVPAEWVGKSLAAQNIRSKYHVNVIGVRSKGVFNVSLTADFIFSEGDIAVVLGDSTALNKIRKL